MKRLLKHVVPVVTASLIGVTATLFMVSPASAARISTTMDANGVMRSCTSAACANVGTAASGTAVRTYCLVGSQDLIFGGANRFGFTARTGLVNETQNTSCFSGGGAGSVSTDRDILSCANAACPAVGDAAFGDALRRYCQRSDSAGNVWLGIFNNNGSQAGFLRASDVSGGSAGMPSC